MLTNDTLLKTRPQYGNFQCSHCGRRWKSTKAWDNHGQNCKQCNTLVYPTNLSKNFVYICDDCHMMWHSCHSDLGLSCENCNSSVLIHPRDPGDWEDQKCIDRHKSQYKNVLNAMNPNGTHNESLCQKCRDLGRPCR
ncbi:hypothetical protein I4U23_004375 [Adineta vaga]|nr:hypothetical protein I4U23_004375 [Adineta vaga]